MGGNSSKNHGQLIDEKLQKELKFLSKVSPPKHITLDEILISSDKFPGKLRIGIKSLLNFEYDEEDDVVMPCIFPVEATRLKTHIKDGKCDGLEDMVNSARPIIHEKLIRTLVAFLYYKKLYGTTIERKIYGKMTVLGLADRLIKKRPMVFCNSNDKYFLLNGDVGSGGFDDIGQDTEGKKLKMKHFMTYDEIKLAALLSISSESLFINDGSRYNHGRPGKPDTFEKHGIIVGQVGARFHRANKMEFLDSAITNTQNTKDNGYGIDINPNKNMMKEWAKLWGLTHLPTWSEVNESFESEEGKINYLPVSAIIYLNSRIYKARIRMSAEVMLAEANIRAKLSSQKAYIHVVGLGLGVWKMSEIQLQLYVDAWGEAIQYGHYDNINHLTFSWIRVTTCLEVSDGQCIPNTCVIIHFSDRNVHDLVPDGCLLVCHYAWDGNSLPGNEYWAGSLTSTSDSAAACSSCISELHNHLINPMITAENLHIVDGQDIIHISEYASKQINKLYK